MTMTIPITELPDGIGLNYDEEHGEEMPRVELEGRELVVPCFVREDEENGGYKWIPVRVPYRGQRLDDYGRLLLQCYSDIRRHFYGSTAAQLELQFKGKFDAHIKAVRKAFPKPGGNEPRTVFTRFEVLKAFQQVEGLYDRLVAAYQSDITVQLYWNSVDDIDLNHPDCIRIRSALGITDEMVAQLVAIIEEAE